jgi:hypothetical protein
MLAWKLEMQQFQLDQLTMRHELKFLKLLGETPRDRQSARSSIALAHSLHSRQFSRGTVFRAGDILFQTERELHTIPDGIQRMTLRSASGSKEIAVRNEVDVAPFYPFTINGEVGSSLEIEFVHPLPTAVSLSFWIELVNRRKLERSRIPANYPAFVPSAKVEWKYAMDSGAGAVDWLPLQLEVDETHGLHQSGGVRWQIPEAHPVKRISVSMASGIYDEVPQIQQIRCNVVAVVQGQALSWCETFASSGESSLQLYVHHALYEDETTLVIVQMSSDDGTWVDWHPCSEWPDTPEQVYRLIRQSNGVCIQFGDGTSGAIPPAGESRIRVIAISSAWPNQARIATGTGISRQTLKLPMLPMIAEQLKIQIGWISREANQPIWQDWARVYDFDSSLPDSLHYMIDEQEGVIHFSDGIQGAVPPYATFPNIRIIQYTHGGGEIGNMKEGQIRTIDREGDNPPLSIHQFRPATGGAEPESLSVAVRRMQKRILEPVCGVTAEDLEQLVKSIPGLSLARVKVLPGYRQGLANYPAEQAFGHTSVVIVPFQRANQLLPEPSLGMIQTVNHHLEPYRLLTTRFHVIAPQYVKVSVRIAVVINPRFEQREKKVLEALNRMFQIYDQEDGMGGWNFGKSVYKADIFDAIHRVPGVLYVQDVWLMADGKDVTREEGGDIRIPPHGLAISGQHEIDIISSQR